MVQDAYHKAETIKEKVKIQKKNKLIPGTTVGARIPNMFGFRMVDGVWFSNGFRFSNDPDRSKSELWLV